MSEGPRRHPYSTHTICVGLYHFPTGYHFKPNRRFFSPFSSKTFFCFFFLSCLLFYFMYYHTSHHHPIPYYIAIIVPHCRRTRTDIHAYMHISRGTLSIRSSVISFLSLPVSTTSILSISYHYNTQRFSQVSSIVQFLSFVFCVFPFRIRSENLLAIEISEVRLSGMWQGSSSSTIQPLMLGRLIGKCEGRNERMRESILVSSRNRCLRSSKQCNLEERQDEATERRYTVKLYLTLGPAIAYRYQFNNGTGVSES